MLTVLRRKKTIAAVMIIILLNNALLPGIAFALTSGPSRPESSSFEPVDTTDMVNVLTGDLAYNIPMLEVPGPEGGYPLSLSYHAGIMPDAEASWVGLGWTLNPGAIDRSVSGFPDDFNGQQNTVRDYWAGGSSSSTTVGLNVGYMGVVSAEMGVTVAHDTFLGNGIGGYASLSGGYGYKVGPLSVGATSSVGLSVDPFDHGLTASFGMGINASVEAGGMKAEGSLGLNLSTNFQSISTSVNGGLDLSVGPLGAHISSSGVQGSLMGATASGYNSVDNARAGKISTESSGFDFSIPVFWWYGVSASLSIAHTYMRYWSDETSAVQTFGTLHYPTTRGYSSNSEYDTYYVADIDDPSYDLLNSAKNDPVKSTGGSLPDYDTYSVLGQGVSGYIRPYGYNLEIYGKGKNVIDGSYWQTNRQNVTDDLSYAYGYNMGTGDYEEYIYHSYTYFNHNPSKLNFRFINEYSNKYTQSDIVNASSNLNFDLNPVYGNNDGDYGFDLGSETLASSKNIEYFTNDEIKNGSAQLKGFIDSHAAGFDRTKNPDGTNITSPDQRIGGFMVTNESGVTYHYALPVYAYNEYTRTELISNVTQFNEQKRPNPYATSWLLTAVTGPDYVDTNHNGKADQGDWGYWVNFEYGKWADNYFWRTPYAGTNKDLDRKFRYYSYGEKELYYLDAITTETHTALFVKQIRSDGRSALRNNNSYSTDQLRLNDIILFNNKDLATSIDQIRNSGGDYSDYATIVIVDEEYHSYQERVHHSENVIDIQDIAALTLNSKILRDIRLNYNYSLCPQSPNSTESGKLTLNSLSFLGKQGQASIPPTTFDYEIPADQVRSSTVSYMSQKSNSNVFLFQDPVSTFVEGDIIRLNQQTVAYYGVVKAVDVDNSGDHVLEIKFVGAAPPSMGGVYTFSTTKNPPYSSENHDMWGMYKVDYQEISGNENLSRLPSRASAKASDVWSLRRIHQALGMTTDIVYEPDCYSNVALYRNASIKIDNITNLGNNSFQVTSTNDFGTDLRDFIRPGDKVQMMAAGDYQQTTEGQDGIPYQVSVGTSISSGDKPNLLVTAVNETSIIISDANFYNQLFNTQAGATFYGGNLSAGGIGNNYGGGLRIKQVINKEPITGSTMAVSYNYTSPGNPALSSGTTSYEPIGVDAISLRGGSLDTYQSVFSKKFSNLLGVVRMVPSPCVMYEYVGVSVSRTADGQTVQQLGSSQYQFEVFNAGMVGVWNESPVRNGNWEISNTLIQNNTNRVGALKKTIRYDSNGNKLSETINHYLHDEQSSESAQSNHDQYDALLNRFNKQGVITEKTLEGRYNDSKFRFVSTIKTEFPVVATGSTTIDYKTGTVTNSQTLGFDFYSGQPTKKLTFDSYGNRFISETTPAYRVYPQMGLKSKNSDNANMLSQSAQEVTYKADQNNNYTGVLSASATVWSNQTMMLDDNEIPVSTLVANNRVTPTSPTSNLNIWRPYQSYNWMPADRSAGITTNFVSFFSAGGALSPAWIKTSEMTLYNKYSKTLEAKDINGNYGATMMSCDQSKVLATASNSTYNEITYAGFEDGVLNGRERGVGFGSATIESGISHTGDNAVQLNGGGLTGPDFGVGASNLKVGRNYTASVWMKTDGNPALAAIGYSISGGPLVLSTLNTAKKAGDWYLLTIQIPGSVIQPGNYLSVKCINNGTLPAYFDDFRFKPANAGMASYVYDNHTGELTYILDGNNMFARFEYDSEGRLTKTYKENFGYGVKQVGENIYNYAQH